MPRLAKASAVFIGRLAFSLRKIPAGAFVLSAFCFLLSDTDVLHIGIISSVAGAFSASLNADQEFFYFTFATAAPSFSAIFDSGMAAPARYLEEMSSRLSLLDRGREHPVFLFNPFHEFSKVDISATLSEISHHDGNAVFVDWRGKPIGYYFAKPVPEDQAHLLWLLSTSDGRMDAALLSRLFAVSTTVKEVTGVEIDRYKPNGFHEVSTAVLEWMARRALDLLERGVRPDTANIMAFMPHHAGDALFFALALSRTASPVHAVAIHSSYEPIVRSIHPELAIASLPGRAYLRDVEESSIVVPTEWQYFLSIKDQLPDDMFFLYVRPSRDYNQTSFHLIDHFAFTLGRRFYDIGDSLAANLPAIKRVPPSGGRRVLVHFDAGWHLKIYPRAWQQDLVDRLASAGFEVTVLTGNAPAPLSGCKIVRWELLEKLSELLKAQSLVIGMDSFPAHWASFALGIPTVAVFGSTHRRNSYPSPSIASECLEQGLPCCPCTARDVCPAFGGDVCRNFLHPMEIAKAAERILKKGPAAATRFGIGERYFGDRKPIPDFADNPAYKLPADFMPLRLWLNILVVRYIGLNSLLYWGERFIYACRRFGVLGASRKALSFVWRRLSRL